MAKRIVDEEQKLADGEEQEKEKRRIISKDQEPERKKQVSHRKSRRRRRNRKKLLLIPVAIVILIIIGLTVFRVQNLKIEGSRRVSEEEVKELIQWDSCQENTLLLWLLNRRVDVSSNELLAKITVTIVDPVTVRVRVEEQSLVAGILIGEQYFYMNDSGLVILSQKDMMPEVPLMEGLDVEKAENGRYLKTGDDAVLNDMLDIAECLVAYDIVVDTVGRAKEGGYKLQVGKVEILLGSDIYMEEKISELGDLIPELTGLSGTLHLENYDSTIDSIIFTKDS